MHDLTLVLAVDLTHVEELQYTWPTWVRYCSWLRNIPLLILYDAKEPEKSWKSRLEFLKHPRTKLVPVEEKFPGMSQRELMLSSFVLIAPKYVKTKWYLKLDTDVAAMREIPKNWPEFSWFRPNQKGQTPVFVSNPWGYTKPADALFKLDVWGNNVPSLKQYPALDVPYKLETGKVVKPRIISWCFFGLTSWCAEMAEYAGDRLPVPSHDTYLWYCAERRGDFYIRQKMKHYGWVHLFSKKNLIAACGPK